MDIHEGYVTTGHAKHPRVERVYPNAHFNRHDFEVESYVAEGEATFPTAGVIYVFAEHVGVQF